MKQFDPYTEAHFVNRAIELVQKQREDGQSCTLEKIQIATKRRECLFFCNEDPELIIRIVGDENNKKLDVAFDKEKTTIEEVLTIIEAEIPQDLLKQCKAKNSINTTLFKEFDRRYNTIHGK